MELQKKNRSRLAEPISESARDIRKILNDKWVLWTSFFNWNTLCFFPFYLVLDYISMSHSYAEWSGNHKQRIRRRSRRSEKAFLDPSNSAAQSLSLLCALTLSTEAFIALTTTFLFGSADQFFSSLTSLVDFLSINNRSVYKTLMILFYFPLGSTLKQKMLMQWCGSLSATLIGRAPYKCVRLWRLSECEIK